MRVQISETPQPLLHNQTNGTNGSQVSHNATQIAIADAIQRGDAFLSMCTLVAHNDLLQTLTPHIVMCVHAQANKQQP